MNTTDVISKKEEEFLKKLGFKKVWAQDKSCFWFDLKMKNPFFRKGVLSVEPWHIIATCLAPKIIDGIDHESEQIISAMEYSHENLRDMASNFCYKLNRRIFEFIHLFPPEP